MNVNMNDAMLISFVTSLTNRNLSEHEIDSLCGYVNKASATSSIAELDNLMNAMKRSEKINAIKAYRCLTNTSLLDAKNAVERHYVSKVENVQT